jgi:hypothetical protein
MRMTLGDVLAYSSQQRVPNTRFDRSNVPSPAIEAVRDHLGFNSAKLFHICDIAKPLYQETNPAHLTLDTAWDSRPVRTSHEETCHILRTAPSHKHSLAIINLPTIIRNDSRYLAQVSIVTSPENDMSSTYLVKARPSDSQ